ncbi:MAG: YdcH family protein [Sneathiella sp.]
MSTTEYVAQLAEKHHRVDDEIQSELTHPSADRLHISELKREKLRLKEKIEELST